MRPEERLVKNKLAINNAQRPSVIVDNLETLVGRLNSRCAQSQELAPNAGERQASWHLPACKSPAAPRVIIIWLSPLQDI